MQTDEFLQEFNKHITYLITFAREINEVDLLAATMPEFRGMQDAGWNTAETAYEVWNEIIAVLRARQDLTLGQRRYVLSLYAQLSEAGGVYEIILNMLGVIELKPYSMWPFNDLVRVKSNPKRIIGPNANHTFRHMAEVAKSLGFRRLSELLEIVFRDDVRNGISHADYVLKPDGLRLRKRNGGNPYVVTNAELDTCMGIGLGFFQLLTGHVAELRSGYNPPKEVIGRFSAERFSMRYLLQSKENGALSISTSSAGLETNEEYERQQKINNRLGGKVFCAYMLEMQIDEYSPLIDEMQSMGFDISIVVFNDQAQLEALRNEVVQGDLWSKQNDIKHQGSIMLATPYGFITVDNLADFESNLPVYKPVEYEDSE